MKKMFFLVLSMACVTGLYTTSIAKDGKTDFCRCKECTCNPCECGLKCKCCKVNGACADCPCECTQGKTCTCVSGEKTSCCAKNS